MTTKRTNCQELQQRLASMAREYWEHAENDDGTEPAELSVEQHIADFLLYWTTRTH